MTSLRSLREGDGLFWIVCVPVILSMCVGFLYSIAWFVESVSRGLGAP
jgi:hypothetical protein